VEASTNSGITYTSTYERLDPPKESDCGTMGLCKFTVCISGGYRIDSESSSTTAWTSKSVAVPLCADKLTEVNQVASANSSSKSSSTTSCSGCITTLNNVSTGKFDCNTASTLDCQGSGSLVVTYKNGGPCYPNDPKNPNQSVNEMVEYSLSYAKTGEKTCDWSGTFTRTQNNSWATLYFDPDYWTPDLTGPLGVYPRPAASVIAGNIFSTGSFLGELEEDSKTTRTPPQTPFTQVSYSAPVSECDLCGPTTFPEFYNDAVNCEQRYSGDIPDLGLEDGQGYGTTAASYSNHGVYSQSTTVAKVRVEHTTPATCYLKVWLKKTTLKYVSGPLSCTPNQLSNEETEILTYEWKGPVGCTAGKTKTCLNECEKPPDYCENEHYSTETWILDAGTPVPGEATSISIQILKYSFIKGYEPDDPDVEPRCKPNGFPPFTPSEECQ